MNKKIINKILDAAVQAPSGDNVQPWRFEVSDDYTVIDLYNLPEKDNSYYNYNQLASHIAHGAAIENIMIACQHLGCHVILDVFPDLTEENWVSHFVLSEKESVIDPLYSAIYKRSTNRFQFGRKKITRELLNSLTDAVKQINTANVHFVFQQNEINLLSKELMVNDRLVFEREDIHHYLFDKIRWNKRQINETLDGMPVETLGLSFVEKLFFPLMRYWWYVKTANYFGLSKIIGFKCWWNCRNASLLGMISIKGDDKLSFVEGGRAIQRLWLEATLQGLSLQPIIGLTLLINRLRKNALNNFSDNHERDVKRAANVLPKHFGVDEGDTLIMAFRAGLLKPVKVTTRRKKVQLK